MSPNEKLLQSLPVWKDIDRLTIRIRELAVMRDRLRAIREEDGDDEWSATLQAATVRLAMVESQYREELNINLREVGRQPLLL